MKPKQLEPFKGINWEERIAKMREQSAGNPGRPPKCARCDDTTWMAVHGDKVVRCPDCCPGADDPIAPTVPFEFQKALLSNYDPLPGNATAIRVMKKFLDSKTGDLYVFGGIGTGKTRLACTLLNEFYRQTRQGMFLRVARLMYELLPSASDDDRERLYTLVKTQPLLVLDDIGAERDEATDFTRRTLLLLYEERGDRGLRTIWTSNKTLADLSQMLDDERLVSRLAGRCEIVEIATTDQRMARRKGLGK